MPVLKDTRLHFYAKRVLVYRDKRLDESVGSILIHFEEVLWFENPVFLSNKALGVSTL